MQKLAATTRAAGLKNVLPKSTASTAFPGATLAPGTYTQVRQTISIPRSSAVTTARTKFTGLESFWRQIQGYFQVDYPNVATATYSIQTQGYYSGSNFIIDTYMINQTGDNVTIPAFTIDAEVFTFVAPF